MTLDPSVAESEARTKRRDRAVLQGAVAIGLARVITAVAGYATLGIAARAMSTDEVGLVAVVISYFMIVTMFDLGIGGALTTRIAASHARDDLVDVRRHLDHGLVVLTALGTLIALAGVVSTIVLPWHSWIGGSVSEPVVTRSLIALFVVSGASLPAAVGFMTLSGLQRFAAVQLGLTLGSLLALVSCAAVVAVDPSPDLFVLAAMGSPVAVSSCFAIWVRLRLFRETSARSRIEGSRLKSMLQASSWYAVCNIANAISLGIGTVIVGSVLGLTEAAIFTVATRLFTPIIGVVAAAGSRLWPGLTEAIGRGDTAWARSRYRRGLFLVGGISAGLSLGLVVFGPWLARLWVGPDLVPPVSLFFWVAVFNVVAAVTSQANVLLTAVERMKGAAVLSVCTAVLCVGASIVLCRQIGVSGAAVGVALAWLLVLLPGTALIARDILARLGDEAELDHGSPA